MNEKGSSLLIVLLITLIFSVLGLSVLGASMNNIKRTEIRELEIETTASSKVLLSEVKAKLQENLDASTIDTELRQKDKPTTFYDNEIRKAIQQTENSFTGVTIDYENEEIYKKYGIENFTDFKKENFLRICEITIDYKGNEGAESSNPTINRKITQNVILSPTPSFLNYAIGSKEKLVINGSPDIIGNVYAPEIILSSVANYEKNTVIQYTGEFQGPSIFGTLYTKKLSNSDQPINPSGKSFYPFFEGNFDEKNDGIIGIPSIKAAGSNFIEMDFDETFFLKWNESDAPKLKEDEKDIIDSNPNISTLNCSDDPLYEALIEAEVLIENGHSNNVIIDDTYFTRIIDADSEIRGTDSSKKRQGNPKLECNKDSLYLIEESMLTTYEGSTSNLFITDVNDTTNTLFFTNIDRETESGPELLLKKYKKDGAETSNILYLSNYLPSDGLLLKKDRPDGGYDKGWLVVNGDLVINGSKNEADAPKIIGNILVNGNLYIRSTDAEIETDPKEYIEFDSTIYVRGETIIDNVYIKGANDKQLVIISNKELKIVRINDYENENLQEKNLVTLINKEPNLKGFFYTHDTATLYGVGSLFQIEGGVFANKELTINAIRYEFNSTNVGSISEISSTISYSYPLKNLNLNSRFYVEYDNRVITDQLNSLPRVNRLQVIADDLFIN